MAKQKENISDKNTNYTELDNQFLVTANTDGHKTFQSDFTFYENIYTKNDNKSISIEANILQSKYNKSLSNNIKPRKKRKSINKHKPTTQKNVTSGTKSNKHNSQCIDTANIKSKPTATQHLPFKHNLNNKQIISSCQHILLCEIFNVSFQFNFFIHQHHKSTPMMKQNNINKANSEDPPFTSTMQKHSEMQEEDTETSTQDAISNKYKHLSQQTDTSDTSIDSIFRGDFIRYPYTCYSPMLVPRFPDYTDNNSLSISDNYSKYRHFLKNPIPSFTGSFSRPYSAPPPRSLIERIDSEHPNFESSEYKGSSRTTTPIGFHPFLKEIRVSERYNNDFENEIEGYLNEGCKSDNVYNFEQGNVKKDKTYINDKNIEKYDRVVYLNTKNEQLNEQSSIKRVEISADRKTAKLKYTVDKHTEKVHYAEKSKQGEGNETTKTISNLNHCVKDESTENSFTLQTEKMAEEIKGAKKNTAYDNCNTINSSVYLSMDQEGSRFIQKRLEKSTLKETQWFYYTIKSHFKTLCLDLFGNYVIQKIIELKLINDEIAYNLIPLVKELSVHMYGCRVIQKILDHDNAEILNEIKKNAILLIEDQNGNHVIQKCVEKSEDLKFLVEIYSIHTIKLCKHRYGCRVIQRLLEHCDDSKVKIIIGNLTNEIEMMMEDQYGNYVLQHIIEKKPKLRSLIIESILCIGKKKAVLPQKIRPHVNTKSLDTLIDKLDTLNLDSYDTSRLLHFCTHKFASNVIEKCVLHNSLFIDIFLRKVNGKPMIVCMAGNKFGNYVVQRVLENKMVRSCLSKWCVELKKSVYAKHILSKIQ